MLYSCTHTATADVKGLRQSCSVSSTVTSTFAVSLNDEYYINSRFTYLLTSLLTYLLTLLPKLWTGGIAAQLNECQPLPVSYKTELNCSSGVTSLSGEVTCRVTCEAGAQFVSDRSEYVTRCGPSTNFSWTHETASRLLPSCSGTAPGCHGNSVQSINQSINQFLRWPK